jgi:hypothetical protein
VKPNVAAACLLAPLKTSLVDVWSDDNSVYRLLTTSDFHYAINISILNRNDFVSLMSMRFPEEWRDLPEVQWDGFNLISSEWVAKLWHFILSTSDPEHETSFVEPFVNSLHILPAFISDEERTLMKVTNNMAIICPVKLISNLDTIVDQICDVLKQVGVRVLDVRSAGKAWTERMAGKVLLPNMDGEIIKVDQLFDPTSPYLTPLLGEARLFPEEIFCQEDILAALRQ